MTHGRQRREAIAYVRGSTSPGAPSETDQRRAVQRWARRAGTRIAQWHVEDVERSAIADRPAILRALCSLGGTGPSVLCVSEPHVVDEALWARVVVEHLAVHAGGRVVYASSGVAARDRTDVDLALEIHERMLLRFRAMRTDDASRHPGPTRGYCPWGYRFSEDGKTLVPYEPEQAARFVARDLRLRGSKLREIADRLKQMGIVGRTGRPLGITRIYELLDEGEGSQRRVLMKRSRAVDEDQPPASNIVERDSDDRARTGPRGGSAAK
ncbi:MAG: hypothetical protein ACLP1X_24935 [Polyangiaceae bacterium]